MGRVSLHQSLTPAAVRDKLRAECLQRVQQHRDSLLWQLRAAAAEGHSAQDVLESVIDRVVEDMGTCGTGEEVAVCTPAHQAGGNRDDETALGVPNRNQLWGQKVCSDTGTVKGHVEEDCEGCSGSKGNAAATFLSHRTPEAAMRVPHVAGMHDPTAGFATPEAWRIPEFGAGGESRRGGRPDTPVLPSMQGGGNRGEAERRVSQREKRIRRSFPCGMEPPYCPNEDIELLLMMERALYEDVLRVQAEAAALDENAAVNAMLETHLGPVGMGANICMFLIDVAKGCKRLLVVIHPVNMCEHVSIPDFHIECVYCRSRFSE